MKHKKNTRYVIKVLINEIEYFEKDKQILLSFIYSFKNEKIPVKKQSLKRNGLAAFIRNTDLWADKMLSDMERPVPRGYSMQINQIFFKYWNAKRRFADADVFDEMLEKKLDRLAEYAAIIECGKIYRIRQKLLNPDCIRLSFFLRGADAYTIYFNQGINQLVNINKYAYTLDAIESMVSRHFFTDRQRLGKRRMFYIHSGKTNSGKTYTALQMLKKAEKGAYLSPLRLLALEISDSLNSQGISCSFVTGEEEKLIENATHIASTVELADFGTEYDVVVIDECQMISDYSRGPAWTKAIMNIKAREICLCTAPEAIDVLVKLIDDCGDYYEIVNHRRKTPLVVEEEAFSIDNVKPGDALVAFSKQKVNAIGAQLIKRGISVSVLYGALPYAARKQQFENFISGKSAVLVTTDAIGMGVNLPVRRVVFMEIYKFDGEISRLLTSGEVKQIAGRAGRRGKFDIGYVNANGERELEFIRKKLNAKTEKVKGICVNFPKKILEDNYISLKRAVDAWSLYDVPKLYIKESLHEASEVIESIIKLYNRKGIDENKQEIFEIATMPVDYHNINVRRLWFKYIEQRLSGSKFLSRPFPKGKTVEDYLNYSKMLDTYFMCSRSWDMKIYTDWLEEQRQMCNRALINGLIDDVERHTRYCKSCSKVLDWNNKGEYCEECDNSNS